jgi:acyl-CoA thioesterase-2
VEQEQSYAETLAELLDLEELDRNLSRGRNPVHAIGLPALYGGQVAAQALMAAGSTVEADRVPHSLHGYFLRAGQVDRPVILRVDPDRDGRSFSARHVAAIQDGKVIFSMLASFQRGTTEDRFDDMGGHDDVPRPPAESEQQSMDNLINRWEVTRTEEIDGVQYYTDCLWMRAAHPLADDPLTQACGLTYISDYGNGFGRRPDLRGRGGPSLDHAVWFHAPARADEWVLLDMKARKATESRGLYEGAMRDLDGRLCAAVVQENLLGR